MAGTAEIGKILLDKTISDFPFYKNAKQVYHKKGHYQVICYTETGTIEITVNEEDIAIWIFCSENMTERIQDKLGGQTLPDMLSRLSTDYIWLTNIDLADPNLVTTLRNTLSAINKIFKKYPKY
jgi:hypothetical protein